jgi:hypothetical protein
MTVLIPSDVAAQAGGAGIHTENPQQCILDEHAEAIRACGKRTIEAVLEIGCRLAEAKKLLGHGNWLPWLQREFDWSEDTAERFIALHALRRQIPQLAELSIPLSGLYLLASPSTPPEVVEAIVAKTQDGEKVGVTEIKAAIHGAKVGEDGKAGSQPARGTTSGTILKQDADPASSADKHKQEYAEADGKATAAAAPIEANTPSEPASKETPQPKAAKSRGAVTPNDTALADFGAHVLELHRRIGKHKPSRFAKMKVKADVLTRLGKFLTDLAQLKAEAAS